jgi:hypothetical protein
MLGSWTGPRMKGLGSIMLSNVCIMILSEWSRPSLQNYVLTDIGLTDLSNPEKRNWFGDKRIYFLGTDGQGFVYFIWGWTINCTVQLYFE